MPLEYQAGTPPRVVTVPYEEDLAALLEDIIAVSAQAQVVVLILHWGIHFFPEVIADYQTTVAHAAFDAGADLILGHHARVSRIRFIAEQGRHICLGEFVYQAGGGV